MVLIAKGYNLYGFSMNKLPFKINSPKSQNPSPKFYNSNPKPLSNENVKCPDDL
jgi:hypothetical protein